MLVSRANGAGGAPGNADSGGQPGLAISDDGTKVVFHSQATNLASATRGSVDASTSFLRDLSAEHHRDGRRGLGGAPSSQWPAISGDGTHVAFITATGLVAGDTDGQLDVYLHRYVPRTGAAVPTPTPDARRRRRRPADPGPAPPPPPPRGR